ncbi:MAG: transglycosylase [Denitrovibrio sp.]|nr:MAG: transglycosylase [Denitrovibrio sp.]
MDGDQLKKVLLVITILSCFSLVSADSFEDFKNQNMGEFDNSKQEFSAYKKEVDKAFEAYKSIMEEEFQAYKDQISKKWDSTEVSTNTKWVEYLNNYNIRKIVDFESKEIQIDIIGGSDASLKPVLKDLLKEDRGDAFRRDPVSFNTEKKLKKQIPNVQSGKVNDEPVISKLFTEKKLNDSESESLAEKLIKNGDIRKDKQLKTGKPVVSLKVKLPEDTYQKSAAKVKPYVEKYAKEFNVNPALVMSVIYNESRFNPLAKSYVPAYGLMQIVPKSAGIDAIAFLEGEKRVLAPSYLYDAENNIKVGAAYLHILYYRYFKGVNDPLSKLYCSIAAYNTGAGNVAYAFNKNNGGRYSVKRALPEINSMAPSQVYKHLKTNLRYDEAKRYIVKVTEKIKDY